ncbi:hypothetical protein V2J09_023807 [Rumex salicifolius]
MKLQRDEASPAPIPPPPRRLSLDAAVFTRDRYKLCALPALLLLALWSMLTGSITLKSSAAVDPVSLIYSSASSAPDDLDVLEVAEREKLVKKLWNVYSHGYGGIGNKIRLPSFWEEAFRAAYENMISDSPAVRDDAVVEIAKMSLISMDLLPSPTQSSGAGETGKSTTSRKLKI